MRGLLATCALLCTLALLHPAQATAGPAKELSVELIFGGEFDGNPPSDYSWSAAGTHLAFLRRSAADAPRLLHVLDTATLKTVTLSQPRSDDESLDVESFSWAPDETAVLAHAGGDLYLVSTSPEGGARRLTETIAAESKARVSPDGKRVAFVRDHDLFLHDLATGREKPLTHGRADGVQNGEIDWVYDEEFEIADGWLWSPDSSRIAYLQFDERQVPTYPIVDWIPTHPEIEIQRYPKAGDPNPIVRLGIVTVGQAVGTAPSTLWLDLGSEMDQYIPRFAWTGDGKSVAVQRLNRKQTLLELLFCDPARGSCRSVLQERDDRWINIGDDWRFLTSGSRGAGFIWGSERDGYRHLYHYDAQGRFVRRITEGPWVVTTLAAVDESRGIVYFTGKLKGPLEDHLYRVGLDGTGLTRITQEDGTHDVLMAGAGGRFVDTYSTVMTPPTVTVKDETGRRLASIDEGVGAALSEYRRGRVEFRDVRASDSTLLPAAITLPPDFDPSRKYPVLVYVYGGPHAQNVRNGCGGSRGLWHQMLAARGNIIWSLDNRGSWNRGHAWEAPIDRNLGSKEMSDQLTGVEYLKTLPYVDGSRLGIWGWSYGGYMTLYCLTNAPGVFKTGVAGAPVTDWRDYDTIYTERYMGRPVENPEGYDRSAPLTKAASLAAHLLLVHGSSDDNVHLQNSIQLLDALVSAGKQVEFMLYPRKKHGILGKTRVHLYERITAFLERTL